jgi:hypothetical protein
MYKTLAQIKQDKCRKFLHEIARGRIMEQGDAADPAMILCHQGRGLHQGGLQWTHQEDSWYILVSTS